MARTIGFQLLAALSVLTCAAGACAGELDLDVGAAMRDITPDPLLPISGGMGPTKPAKEKRGDLSVRALVLSRQTTTIAIVGIDLLGFPSALGERVAAKVPRLKPENILIGASHTHSAPDAYAFPDGKGGHTANLHYLDQVVESAAAAINEAIDKRIPADMKVGTTEAKGKIAYNYYAPDLYDRRVHTIQFEAHGKVLATLVNYAIHPEILGPNSGILSPDLVGPLRQRVEESVGGMCIFMNSAQGGMITADNRDLEKPTDASRGYWKDKNTWDECLRVGMTLADEALRALKGAKTQSGATLSCTYRNVRFPVESDQLWAVVKQSPLRYRYNEDRSITARVNLVQLGDAQMLTIPGEALPNIGFYLKRKMTGRHNLLFGLTNDAFGYIMTKVDYKSFPRYDYISRVSLGEMTGEILIEESLKLIAGSRPSVGARTAVLPPQPPR